MAESAKRFTRTTTPDSGRAAAVREEMRRGLEERPEIRPTISPPRRTAAQMAALSLGIASLAVGTLGMMAPVVTGNRDKVINLRDGKLFGVFAVNPLHAAVHAAIGAWGLVAQRSEHAARRYLQVSAGAFSALTAAGFIAGRKEKGIYHMMGMALNTADNWLHAVWGGASALFALRPRLGQAM